jgi:hypothetical protein
MIVVPYGEDCCRGGEGHSICGFYDSTNDSCWYALSDIHGRSCCNYEADDSCMFCGRRKKFLCPETLDFIPQGQKRCDSFSPIDIKDFTR